MFSIEDSPMKCCGMVSAEGLSSYGVIGGQIRYPDAALLTERFTTIDQAQRGRNRNCAIITLSSNQQGVIDIAKARGWKEVFSFYNPNSGNQCYILTHVLYEDRDDYRKQTSSYDEDDF